jgi:stearoyl-CoA desaturase (delta-9 desaturase)
MTLVLFCLAYYLAAGLAVNLGYHRCLSHRALRLSKPLERALVTLGLPAGTPVQWAGNHRFHHRHADAALDPHSPVRGGFWHAHVGWYIGTPSARLCALYALGGPLRTLFDGFRRPRTNQQHNALARDVSADAYYRFMSRRAPFLSACVLHVVVPFGLASLVWGWRGIASLWLTSVLIYNVGDAIDSLAHLRGRRPDASAPHFARNNALLGVVALGEGWHANHHTFPTSACHGLLPRQFDWTWGVIRLLMRAGLASDVRLPEESSVREKLAGRSMKGCSEGKADAI